MALSAFPLLFSQRLGEPGTASVLEKYLVTECIGVSGCRTMRRPLEFVSFSLREERTSAF